MSQQSALPELQILTTAEKNIRIADIAYVVRVLAKQYLTPGYKEEKDKVPNLVEKIRSSGERIWSNPTHVGIALLILGQFRQVEDDFGKNEIVSQFQLLHGNLSSQVSTGLPNPEKVNKCNLIWTKLPLIDSSLKQTFQEFDKKFNHFANKFSDFYCGLSTRELPPRLLNWINISKPPTLEEIKKNTPNLKDEEPKGIGAYNSPKIVECDAKESKPLFPDEPTQHDTLPPANAPAAELPVTAHCSFSFWKIVVATGLGVGGGGVGIWKLVEDGKNDWRGLKKAGDWFLDNSETLTQVAIAVAGGVAVIALTAYIMYRCRKNAVQDQHLPDAAKHPMRQNTHEGETYTATNT